MWPTPLSFSCQARSTCLLCGVLSTTLPWTRYGGQRCPQGTYRDVLRGLCRAIRMPSTSWPVQPILCRLSARNKRWLWIMVIPTGVATPGDLQLSQGEHISTTARGRRRCASSPDPRRSWHRVGGCKSRGPAKRISQSCRKSRRTCYLSRRPRRSLPNVARYRPKPNVRLRSREEDFASLSQIEADLLAAETAKSNAAELRAVQAEADRGAAVHTASETRLQLGQASFRIRELEQQLCQSQSRPSSGDPSRYRMQDQLTQAENEVKTVQAAVATAQMASDAANEELKRKLQRTRRTLEKERDAREKEIEAHCKTKASLAKSRKLYQDIVNRARPVLRLKNLYRRSNRICWCWKPQEVRLPGSAPSKQKPNCALHSSRLSSQVRKATI